MARQKKSDHPKVDEVFSSLLRPLTPTEYQRLEASQVAAKRILEDLEIWHDLVVDGHHRLTIAKQHDLPYGINVLDPTWPREAVIQHIVDKHLGRRNLTPTEYEELIARTYEAIKKDHGDADRFATPPELDGIPKVQNEPLEDSSEKVAKQFGTSKSTVKRAVDRTALREGLVEELKRTLAGCKKKLTDDQLKALAALPEGQQIEAAGHIRKFSRTIDEACKLVSGKSVKTLAGTCTKKAKAGEAKEPKEAKPRDDAKFLLKQWAGMVKTIDSLVKRIDELTSEGLITRPAAKPILVALDVPRKVLWRLAHPSKK